MKEIFIILFILCALSSYSEIHGVFQMGHDLRKDVAFTRFEVQYDFDIWKINIMPYGSITTWFKSDWESLFNQSPFRNIYEAGLKSTIGILFVDLNHFCNHAVYASYSKKNWYDMRWADSLTTLSIGLQW